MKLIAIAVVVAVAVVAYQLVRSKPAVEFIGCYADKKDPRALPSRVGYPITSSDAFAAARAQNLKYVGLQAGGMADSSNLDVVQAWGSSDATYDKHGKYEAMEGTSNCQKVDGTGLTVGGDWSNAVYRLNY